MRIIPALWLIVLALVGCKPNEKSAVDYSIRSAGGPRVYLFSGFPGDKSQWTAAPQTWLADKLSAADFEVVLLAVPPASPSLFTQDGATYRSAFISYVNSVVQSVEQSNGARKSFVGGVSYGGLHAMMAYATTGKFNGWFAHVPVTKLNALSELKDVGDVPAFDPFRETFNAPGYITWANADERVNYRLTQQVAVTMPVAIRKIEYPGGHETTMAELDAIVGWLQDLK